MFNNFPTSAKVWIYQSNRPFNTSDVIAIDQQLNEFSRQWTSHSLQLRAEGRLLYEHFVVLMVDESQAGASGCSIDKSVRFIRQLEATYQINLFDRLCFAYRDGDKVRTADRDTFSRLYAEGILTDDTIVFDNLVATKADFDTRWEVRLADSWHKQFV